MPILWALISLLVVLFVVAIVIYVVKLILDMLAFPDPAKKIAYLIVGLIALVVLIGVLGNLNMSTCASILCR